MASSLFQVSLELRRFRLCCLSLFRLAPLALERVAVPKAWNAVRAVLDAESVPVTQAPGLSGARELVDPNPPGHVGTSRSFCKLFSSFLLLVAMAST